ncbi:TauD/TfdA family dioxygenase [Alphaproteobacteria bacterium]|nr:TauD/TfdA family dioxygenase [Alphaproteobacteria bacterium]
MGFSPRSNRDRVPATPMQPIVDPAGWTAQELAADDDWIYNLSNAECDEIITAVEMIEKRGLYIKDIGRNDFVLPRFVRVMSEMRDELLNGRGFVLIRGLPVAQMTRTQSAIAYWGLGVHLGRAVSQNGKGHLLGHVKDIGADYGDANIRGYLTKAHMGFHSDRCDYVGLLCLQPAKSGGESRIASAVTQYNEILARRRDLMEELVKDYCWSWVGEPPPGELPYYKMPVFSFQDGHMCVRGVSTQIFKSQGMAGVPNFTDRQIEALEFYKSVVDEIAFDMEFSQGDIQILHNHVTLHSRRGFTDWSEPERKRHLLRLWLYDDNGRAVLPAYRKVISGIHAESGVLTTPLDVEDAA